MTGPILLVIGVVALFAAIVGGGIKFRDIEVGDVKSLWRQWLLGAFGLVVSLIGLGFVTGVFDNNDGDKTTENVENAEQEALNRTEAPATDTNANDQNTSEATGTDTNALDDNNSTEESSQPH